MARTGTFGVGAPSPLYTTRPRTATDARRTFAPARPLPGVVPENAPVRLAMDEYDTGLMGAYNSQFNGGGGGEFGEGLHWLGFPYLAELTQRGEYRRIIETMAREMTRSWINVTKTGGEDQTRVKIINDELKRHRVQDKFRRVAELDGYFGRGHLYLDVGISLAEPELLKTAIIMDRRLFSRGMLKNIKIVEPSWTYPGMYNSSNPIAPDFYVPTTWYVMSREVHKTRLLTFVSRPMPDILKPAYSFGGLSMSQMVKPYVDKWLRAQQSVSDLIHSFATPVLGTDMSSIMNGGAGEQAALRALLFNVYRDNRGLFMIDKEKETFEVVQTSLGTLDHLQAQAQEHMASISGEPLVIMTGISPSGLNASSEGELQVWAQTVNAMQTHLFDDNLKAIIDAIQLDQFGDIDPGIGHEWNPLEEESDQDKSSRRKSEADAHAAYITAGVLDPSEVRQVLASDPESPYAGVDLSGPPPTPPEAEADPLAAGAPGGPGGGETPGGGGSNLAPPKAPRPSAKPLKPGDARGVRDAAEGDTIDEIARAIGRMRRPAPVGDAEFEEGDHPRGQPGNAGQFAKSSMDKIPAGYHKKLAEAYGSDRDDGNTPAVSRAMEEYRFEQEKLLTSEEKEALDYYKADGGYLHINRHLLGKSGYEKAQSKIDLINEAMKKLVVPFDTPVYRGMNVSLEDLTGVSSPKEAVGTHFEHKNFVSTSRNREASEIFGAQTVLKFTIPAGSPGIVFGEQDESPDYEITDKEIILPAKSVFRVDKVDGNTVHVTLLGTRSAPVGDAALASDDFNFNEADVKRDAGGKFAKSASGAKAGAEFHKAKAKEYKGYVKGSIERPHNRAMKHYTAAAGHYAAGNTEEGDKSHAEAETHAKNAHGRELKFNKSIGMKKPEPVAAASAPKAESDVNPKKIENMKAAFSSTQMPADAKSGLNGVFENWDKLTDENKPKVEGKLSEILASLWVTDPKTAVEELKPISGSGQSVNAVNNAIQKLKDSYNPKSVEPTASPSGESYTPTTTTQKNIFDKLSKVPHYRTDHVNYYEDADGKELRAVLRTNTKLIPGDHYAKVSSAYGSNKGNGNTSEVGQAMQTYGEEQQKSLTGKEKRSLTSYKGSGYSQINSFLLGGMKYGDLDEIQEDVDNINEAMKKSVVPAATPVYRGMNVNLKGLTGFDDPEKAVGRSFEHKNFASVSRSRSTSEFFGSKTMLHFTIPAGAPGIVLGSQAAGEKEIVLPARSVFRVDKVADGLTHVTWLGVREDKDD